MQSYIIRKSSLGKTWIPGRRGIDSKESSLDYGVTVQLMCVCVRARAFAHACMHECLCVYSLMP